MEQNPRLRIGDALTGDVLEIGPGSNPFPTAPEARVKYADRSVKGGRDVNWPELIGHPLGINADFNINLDVDSLSPISDNSFDAVVVSHVLEHLANPVKAIREFERVLRPGGKLVLILPDRTKTFDKVRVPTTLSHVLNEFHQDITEVSDAHIIEFCASIYGQKPIHPDEVREWHNPDKLDDALFSLHRRRSIHVHCWSPEEFAALVAGLLAQGLICFKLRDLYFVEDFLESGEFGLVLERSLLTELPKNQYVKFIDDWISLVLQFPRRNLRRVIEFQYSIFRDINEMDNASRAISVLSERLIEQLDIAKNRLDEQAAIILDRDIIIRSVTNSISWRVVSKLHRMVNAVRRFI